MDITPNVNLLRSIRGHRIDYVALVGEGCDNSLDAQASEVDVVINDDEISFKDNGIGITRNRIRALFSLGEHGQMTSTQLGRFGVGIKHQAINAGNLFEVVSTSREGTVMARVDWRKVLASQAWVIDDPRWRPFDAGAVTGTTITISELQPARRAWESRIVNEMAERFHPALADGRKITINGKRVPLLPEPEMSDVIERQISLSAGRNAHVKAGILLKPSSLHSVHVGYKHRIMMNGCALGCGEYSGLTKMFARVQISGPWHLGTYKDDLPNADERDELEDAVLETLRPILEKCNVASMSAKIIEISRELNDLVPPELSPARPKRQKEGPPSPGTKKSKRGKVAAGKSDPPGPALAKRTPRNELIITFDGDAEREGVGAFVAGRPHRVNLSKDDPDVARLIEHRDHHLGIRALYMLALALFEQGRGDLIAQPDLFGMSFGKRIAQLLAIQELRVKD